MSMHSCVVSSSNLSYTFIPVLPSVVADSFPEDMGAQCSYPGNVVALVFLFLYLLPK